MRQTHSFYVFFAVGSGHLRPGKRFSFSSILSRRNQPIAKTAMKNIIVFSCRW